MIARARCTWMSRSSIASLVGGPVVASGMMPDWHLSLTTLRRRSRLASTAWHVSTAAEATTFERTIIATTFARTIVVAPPLVKMPMGDHVASPDLLPARCSMLQ